VRRNGCTSLTGFLMQPLFTRLFSTVVTLVRVDKELLMRHQRYREFLRGTNRVLKSLEGHG
jgi:hypothetical protein